MAASGLQAWVVQQEGRWKSGAFTTYERVRRKEFPEDWRMVQMLEVLGQDKEQCGEGVRVEVLKEQAAKRWQPAFGGHMFTF